MSLQPLEKRRQATQDVPVKRFRVSRACDQCRNSREKCDANQPSCSPCLDMKRSCTYTSTPKKRGLQPGYIRGLEMTLAYIFQQHTEIESSVHDQLAQENTVLLARGTKDSNRLHKSWTKSRFCRNITKALSGEQISTSEDRSPSPDEDSEVDTEDATLLQTTPKPQSRHSISWQSNASYVPQEMGPPPLPELHSPCLQQPTESSSLVPLPKDCWKLIEVYCTYTQCWLPIAEKLEILKLSYSYPEQGLVLSCDMFNSGIYAEMWSVFAVGSIQDGSSLAGDNYPPWPSGRFYNIARQLIPNELGTFELGHSKALLNLALFNINKKLFDAAWHLVGAALRISLILAESRDSVAIRQKHVLLSCFVLDSLLALHLKRRPYLDRADLLWVGKIEEDGMEEWQPWSGRLNLDPSHASNSPTLALSTFNALTELVDILRCTSMERTAPNFLHEMIGRLEMWKSALPQKLGYIQKDSASTPPTPPALLLRFTYLVTAFTLVPSQAWLQQILEMLSALQRQLGFTRIPGIVACLLQSTRRNTVGLNLDQPTHTRFRELFAAFVQSSHETSERASTDLRIVPATLGEASSESPGTIQMSPQSLVPQVGGPFTERYQHPPTPSTMVHADMNTGHQRHGLQPFEPNLFDFGMTGPIFDPHDPYNALVSGDLGSFLDDFASKHGAKKLQNQPQFMENLGFSSEVSMADLLAADPGRFMPTASNIGADNGEESPQFPLNTFYDTG